MKPTRLTYTVMARTWYGMLRPVLRFRTALDLDRIPGLRGRIKTVFGPVIARV